MPILRHTIDEIMARERRDMLFIRFGHRPFQGARFRTLLRHMKWFKANNLRLEPTAPPGWLEGNSGYYAVYFDSPQDPRVAAYAAQFEDGQDQSLEPDEYQMFIVSYRDWQQHKAAHPDPPNDD